MEHMTTPQTLFVFGHEMGHYVLRHIPKELTIVLLQLLVLFYLGYRLANWMVAHYGARWAIPDLSDWASLPLLFLILSVLTFLATPAFNAVSRHYEHQADQYHRAREGREHLDRVGARGPSEDRLVDR